MKSNAVISKFKEASRLTGIFSRISGELGVSANHVREVAVGNRTSGRVMKALAKEMRRIERESRMERAA